MFFFAALFFASFLLSALLAPKPKIENAKASSLSDFNFPRAKEGDPIPRGYGTWKSRGPNTIHNLDFEAEPIKEKVKTGLFSSKTIIKGYKYKIGLALAVALGECVTFRRMWFGKDEVWNDCIPGCQVEPEIATLDMPELYGGKDRNGGIGGTIAFYSGSFDQEPDEYLVSKIETEAEDTNRVPAYVGIAYAVFRHFYFGNSSSIEAVSFELQHFSNSLSLEGTKFRMENGLDANPIEVLYDLYINDWGNLKVNAALINIESWQAAAIKLWDEGNGWSGEIANAQEGAEISKSILSQINGMIYEDPTTGLIELELIRNDYELDDLPTFGPSEIKSIKNYTKKLWGETFNRMRVKYEDRDQNWKQDAVAVQDDFANIRFQNRIRATEVSMPGVKYAALANAICARELSNRNVPLFQAELLVTREMITLKPGRPFKMNWPEYNIAEMVLRIRKFDLGDRDDGYISAYVVQDEFAIDATVYGDPESAPSLATDYDPKDIVEYKIFELPWFFVNAIGAAPLAGKTRYAVMAIKPGTASLRFFMFIEDSGPDGDINVLDNAPYNENARLSAAMGKFDGFVTGIIPSVTIKNVSKPAFLTNLTEADVRAGAHMFYLDNELMSYETFVDNGDNTYDLVNVHRSMIDTPFEAHAANARLMFFDGQEGFVDDEITIAPFDSYLIDRAFNGRSSVDTATVNELEPIGRPLLPAPPDYVTVEGSRALGAYADAGATVTVAWRERTRLAPEIVLEGDATGAPEAGTTYTLQLWQGLTMLAEEVGIAANTFDFELPSDAVGDAEIQVWAVKGGEASFSPAIFPLLIVGTDTLTIDDEPVTIDAETIEFS